MDRKRRLVAASAFGLGRQISPFREGLGCTHVVSKSKGKLRANLFAPTPDPDIQRSGRRVNASIFRRSDRPALEKAVDAAFAELDLAHPGHHTRTLVVVCRGRIVASDLPRKLGVLSTRSGEIFGMSFPDLAILRP